MVTKGWVKKLFEETERWVAEGLISPEQKQHIGLRYSGKVEYKRLINTVTTLGSILIGLGILLFVASNWDKLGRPAKLIIIFTVISAFNLAAYYFRQVKKEYLGLGEGFLVIGAFSFGAGIWLIAQMYQIHYNFSAGILFWILGILPVAYLYRSWPVLSLSSILCAIWFFSYTSYYPQRESYGFLLLLCVIISLSYIQRQRFPLFIMIAALLFWLGHFWFINYKLSDFSSGGQFLIPQLLLTAIYASLGFVLLGIGIWQARSVKYAAFSFLYKFLGVLLVAISVYSLTFAHHYEDIGKSPIYAYPQKIIFLICVLSASAVFILFRLHASSKERLEAREIRAIFYFLVSQLLAILLSLIWPCLTSLSFNLFLITLVLGFMYLGYLRHSEGIFRLSIAIFFLDILSRYFDIFWKMMPRSLLFIFGGVFLVAGAVFAERKRRQIEEKMHVA